MGGPPAAGGTGADPREPGRAGGPGGGARLWGVGLVAGDLTEKYGDILISFWGQSKEIKMDPVQAHY